MATLTPSSLLLNQTQAKALAAKALTYFSNNRHRMCYPDYRAKGYQIGSGTVDSACKQIVTQRLKVAGAIWNLDNAIKTAKARATLLSGQWDSIASPRVHLSLPLAGSLHVFREPITGEFYSSLLKFISQRSFIN